MIQQFQFWVYIQKNKNTNCKDTCTPMFKAALFMYTRFRSNPNARQINKEDVVHIYTMKYYSVMTEKK